MSADHRYVQVSCETRSDMQVMNQAHPSGSGFTWNQHMAHESIVSYKLHAVGILHRQHHARELAAAHSSRMVTSGRGRRPSTSFT